MAITYETLKETLKAHGEIIATMDSGEQYEIHSSDVRFLDSQKNITWDSGSELWIVDGEACESILVHSSHRMD